MYFRDTLRAVAESINSQSMLRPPVGHDLITSTVGQQLVNNQLPPPFLDDRPGLIVPAGTYNPQTRGRCTG